MSRSFARFATVVAAGLLVACGGGSGSSGGSGGNPAPSGTFTLSANAAAFNAVAGGAAPAQQTYALHVTGTGVGTLVAGYTSSQSQASWLKISISGSGTSFQLGLGVEAAGLAAGTYLNEFTVATEDSGGKVLQSQKFSVTLNLLQSLSASLTPAPAPFGYGSDRLTDAVSLAVASGSRPWTVQSDQAWLHVPSGTQAAAGTVALAVDVTGLAPGAYSANVTVSSADGYGDSVSLPLPIVVMAPLLSVSQGGLQFGGADGRLPMSAQPIDFWLSTGTAAHPYTVSVTAVGGGGNWLSVSPASGTASGTATRLTVTASRSGLPGGTYNGSVELASVVDGITVRQSVPVTLNIEANRLLVTADGIGLSSVAGRNVLSRSVRVLSTAGSTSTAWSAAADVPWLTVTANGTTGGTLTVTANPTGLPDHSTSYGVVTITSADPTVENRQSIRVGLHLSSTAPIDGTPGAGLLYNYSAASPVDQEVAVTGGGTDVDIYDVDTGSRVRVLSHVAAATGSLVYSSDGSKLFVSDTTNLKVIAVDPYTGATLASYDSNAVPTNFVAAEVGFVRPAGYPMLIVPNGHVYDLATGLDLDGAVPFRPALAGAVAVSPDQSLVVDANGAVYRITRSALQGQSFNFIPNSYSATTAQGRQGEACISADGLLVYTASGWPYNFPATSLGNGQVAQVLPGTNYPDSMLCLWNDLVIGGVDGYYAQRDIFIYHGPSGAAVGQISSSIDVVGAYRSLLVSGMAVSADATRIATLASTPGSSIGQLYFQSLPPWP